MSSKLQECSQVIRELIDELNNSILDSQLDSSSEDLYYKVALSNLLKAQYSLALVQIAADRMKSPTEGMTSSKPSTDVLLINLVEDCWVAVNGTILFFYCDEVVPCVRQAVKNAILFADPEAEVRTGALDLDEYFSKWVYIQDTSGDYVVKGTDQRFITESMVVEWLIEERWPMLIACMDHEDPSLWDKEDS
jgi:hypothetical protein